MMLEWKDEQKDHMLNSNGKKKIYKYKRHISYNTTREVIYYEGKHIHVTSQIEAHKHANIINGCFFQ
jgi:hypothetical protein